MVLRAPGFVKMPLRSERKRDRLLLRRLLLLRSGWFEDRMVEAASRFGYPFVTPAMNRLFAHMGGAPVSIAELGRKLAISRQAVHQTVMQARKRGLVELCDDPQDRRVKCVRFSAKGEAMSRRAATAIEQIVASVEKRIGRRDVDALVRILGKDWGE